jgi:hypothetical protein
VLGLLLVAVLLAACSSSKGASPTTVPASKDLDCSRVHELQAKIATAQAGMIDSSTTAPQQIAIAAEAIAKATEELGQLTQPVLPLETATWIKITQAYAVQIQGGARNGTPVAQLLMHDHAFDTQAYRRAAEAVGSYLSRSCPD